MNIFRNIFRTKSAKLNDIPADAPINGVPQAYRSQMVSTMRETLLALGYTPNYGGVTNGLDLFFEFAEVFFPIDYIASRIAGAHFEIRRVSDDSIVWCTGRSYKAQRVAQILSKPNCLQTWSQFVYMHFVSRLATGNTFVRAAMADSFGPDTPKWKWCSNLWTIPTPLVNINTQGSGTIPLFGIAGLEDIIKDYTIGGGMRVPTWQIWHDRDGMANLGFQRENFLYSQSRLRSAVKNISTLRMVYDARNIIYSRCGALGIITNKTRDDAGPITLKPAEKEKLLKSYSESYGVTGGKSPILISEFDLDYKSIGMNIAQLQPFEETLLDAIVIAGQFGIPDVLVPRKDHSTFNNQSTAEKGVYTGVIIPMANTFCQELTAFLGIEDAGLYISCNFDDVDCLQVGRKDAETVKDMVYARMRQQFNDGLITFNDLLGACHLAAVDDPIFSKTKFEMTDEELSRISRIMNNQTAIPQQEKEDETEDDESGSPDESE